MQREIQRIGGTITDRGGDRDGPEDQDGGGDRVGLEVRGEEEEEGAGEPGEKWEPEDLFESLGIEFLEMP